MPGMPYHLEKGPLLTVLEAFCNDSRPRLVDALGKLRANDTLTDIGPFDDPTLYAAGLPDPYTSLAALIGRFNADWLGGQAPGAAYDTQVQTGHWYRYIGPVEEIMRQTLIRAAEVALGIDHGADAGGADRHWPIDFWWKCPQPWFEGWVTWRMLGDEPRQGHVTVILATPADVGAVVLQDPSIEGTEAPTGYLSAAQGSWVVSAKQHTKVVALRPLPFVKGHILVPAVMTRDEAPVVTVAPNYGSGGVYGAPAGSPTTRTYQGVKP